MTVFMNIINKRFQRILFMKMISVLDVNPAAPTHVLLIPKSRSKLSDASPDDQAILGHLMVKVGEITRKLGCEDAFRIVINNGKDATNSIFYIYIF